MAISALQAKAVFERADCLYPQAQVEKALDSMAEKITARIKDTNPLVLCVMTGGLVPTSELLLRLNFPLELDYVHATRYGDLTQGGELKWIAQARVSLKERTSLVIDDILDEGQTLHAIIEHCKQSGAEVVYSAVLVDKEHERKAGLTQADFTGLMVPDRYVFGFGMDYKGYYRNTPGIYAAQKEDE